MKPVPTIGLIGCGNWGKNILRDLLSLGAQVSVATRSEESKETARSLGAAKVVSTVQELGQLDGAIVATPADSHFEVIETLLECYPEIPISSEKPLTDNLNQAEILLKKTVGRLFVLDNWAYHEGIRQLAAIAQNGSLGEILGIRSIRFGWGSPHLDDAVWTLCPHDICITREVLGYIPEPLAAVAEVLDQRPVAISSILGGKDGRPWAVLEASVRSPNRLREVRVFGSKAVATFEDGGPDVLRLFYTTGDPKYFPPAQSLEIPFKNELPLLRELREFVEFVRGTGPEPRCGVESGVAVVKTVATLRRLAGLDRK